MKQSKETNEFLQSYDEFADAIFRHCYFRVSSRELAQDITQETFTRTWQYIADGKNIQHMRGFLYRVANNLIIEEYRRKKAKPVSLDVLREKGFDPGVDEQHTIRMGIEAKDMIAFLDTVDSKYRDIIIMRYIDELSPKEIAEILGEKENTVSVRLTRAMSHVREKLSETA